MIVIYIASVKTYSLLSVASLEKALYGTFPAWWSWQAVPSFTHTRISIKPKNQNKNFQPDRTILSSLTAGRGNCLHLYSASDALYNASSQKVKYRDKKKVK